MSIVYVKFEVSMHRLNLASEEEMEALKARMKDRIEGMHPEGYSNLLDSDVEVEIIEHAGLPNTCANENERA